MLLAARAFRGNRRCGTWITSEIMVAERTTPVVETKPGSCPPGPVSYSDRTQK